MTRPSDLLRGALEWILAVLGVLGSVLSLASAFGLPLPSSLFYGIPLLALGACLAFRSRWSRRAALIGLGLLVLMLLVVRRELWESLRNLWIILGGRYAMGYDQVRDLVPRDPVTAAGTEGALMALALVETYVLCLSVSLWRRTFPGALAMLLGIAPCFVLQDTPPDLLPILAAAFSVLTQALSQAVRRREEGEANKAVTIAALASAALLALLILLFPREDYKPPLRWEDLSEKLEDWAQERNNQGNVNAGLSGNPEEVDLTALGSLPNHANTVLYVTSDLGGPLYLRGSAYTVFDGSSWRRSTPGNWTDRQVYPHLLFPDQAALTVRTVKQEDLLYTTYQMTDLPAGGRRVGDAYLENVNGRMSYTMHYMVDPGPMTPDTAYAIWVENNCLSLPETTRRGVLAWWESRRVEEAKYTAEGFARAVAAAVSETAVYSRSPLRMPEEAEDFSTWFLNEAEEGYCVHFATACTALLRALDIPARYVSGYVCAPAANETTPVTSLQAHAWVEAWIDGRWIPLEPTPGGATEFTGALPGSQTPIPGETGETTPYTETVPATTEGDLPADTLPEEAATRPTLHTRHRPGASTEATQAPGGQGGGSGPGGEDADLTWLWIFLGAILALALPLARRAIAQMLREARLARAKGNEKARLLFRRCQRLSRHSGMALSQEVLDLGQKAAFSQHELEPEEMALLLQAVDQQVCRLGIMSFHKRFWYRYVLAIV